MFKFFRRYNKWILAVGGSLLLISFLLGQVITQMAGQAGLSGATWARIGPQQREITQEERRQIAIELDVLRVLNPQLRDLFAELGALQRPEHWYLLTHEAEQAGLVAGPADAATILGPDADQTLASFQQATGYSRDFLLRTFSRINGVMRLFREYRGSTVLSDRRLRNEAARLFQQATADLVVITADENVDYEPTEDELQAHLSEYAEYAPDDPDHPFGYRLPDRVKVEWITIPAEEVRDVIRDSDDMDRIELWQHWQRNEDQFGPIEEGADIPDRVREDRLNTLTESMRESISRYGTEELRRPRRGLDRRGGYYTLPDDWDEQMLPLDEFALQLQQQFDLPLPRYNSTGGQWIALDDLDQLGPIADAGTDQFGEERLRLPRLIRAALEFDAEEIIPIQEGIAGPPLTDDNDTLYFFRIIDTDPARPPRSVDEVRDRLVRDLKRKHHYEQLRQQVDAMKQTAAERGMLRLALDYNTRTTRQNLSLIDAQTLQFQQMVGMPPSVSPTEFPEIGSHRETLETILERARELSGQYESLLEVDESDRIMALPVDDRLAVVVARLAAVTPLTEEQYRQYAANNQIQQLVLNEEITLDEAFLDAFSYEALAERHRFRLVNTDDDDSDALNDTEADDQDASENADDADTTEEAA